MPFLPSLATVEELAQRAGEPITDADDVAHAQSIIDMASALVRAYVGQDLTEFPVPDAAALVAIDVAYRVWSNPDGLVGDSIDDASRRWSERSSTEGFYLTAGNKMMLEPLRRPASNRGIWTLGVEKGAGYLDTIYIPTGPPPSGPPFPWYAADDPLVQ